MSASVFSDGGGIWIGPDGRIHIIPPWNPPTSELLTAVLAAFSAVASSTMIADRGARQNALKATVDNLNDRVRDLGKLGGMASNVAA